MRKITYHNNSKDYLEYLWVQLDQNMRAKDSKSLLMPIQKVLMQLLMVLKRLQKRI